MYNKTDEEAHTMCSFPAGGFQQTYHYTKDDLQLNWETTEDWAA